MGVRVCIMGHSGVGKSPLADLFDAVGWEPFRVRTPRDADDARVCKPPDEYEKLVASCRAERPLLVDDKMGLTVHRDWSFFGVRKGPAVLGQFARQGYFAAFARRDICTCPIESSLSMRMSFAMPFLSPVRTRCSSCLNLRTSRSSR